MQYLYPLANTVQYYDWGSPDSIPALTGIPNPEGLPMAELWMGAHPKAPSLARLPKGTVPLDELIRGDPAVFLGPDAAGRFGGLPYLLKLLAAGRPLSIQAHPNKTQARDGWDRENRAGIPLGAPDRNYKDANHKPEIMCALTPFRAMCGFRSPREIRALLDLLDTPVLDSCRKRLMADDEDAALRGFLSDLFSLSGEDGNALTNCIRNQAGTPAAGEAAYAREWAMMDSFARLYPGDPAVVAPLYLNVIDLKPGEAVFLPAGVLHAYVEGFGVELMANSDNVLRGGLTAKYVDVQELTRILRFEPHLPKILGDGAPEQGPYRYRTPAEEFSLTLVRNPKEPFSLSPGGPYIVVATAGVLELRDGSGGTLMLSKGESAFISAAAPQPTLGGAFTAFAAGIGSAVE